MAIDYGDAHTGVAISDPTGFLAGMTTTIHSRKAEVSFMIGMTLWYTHPDHIGFR